MMRDAALDLPSVDARVGRAAAAVERGQALLATKDGREAARATEPLDAVRDVAGQSTFQALRALEPGPVHAPHRDALLRWVHELLQYRVSWSLVVDEADAIHAPDPSLSPKQRTEAEGALPITYDEVRRALVVATGPVPAERALERLAGLASPVAAVRKELRARRFEAARRLGLEHPWALATGASVDVVASLARATLDATEPLARELQRSRDKNAVPGAKAAALAIDDAFARDAREGWPARLTTRWLEEVFRALAPRRPRVPSLPAALGGASFLRAAARWGAALRLSAVARTLPFALARDPYPIDAYVVGGALAVAVAGRAFARRKFGIAARSTDAHARPLHRSLFFSLRMLAAEVALGKRDAAPADEIEELTARVFGAPLAPALAQAWSFGGLAGATRIDAPARLVAALRVHAFVRGLVDRFDEDWFDNPRAGTFLASIGAGPVWSADVPDPATIPALGRSFEELLG